MTTFLFINDINTQLAGSISSSATSITLASSLNLPSSIPSGYSLVITLRDAATRQNTEIVYATAITGTTLTVVRGQEGTTAQSWATGDYAYSGVTAGQMYGVAQGTLLGVQVITSSSTYNKSPGTQSVIVEAIGGGGGSSGNAATSASQWAVCAGGGGGSYAIARYLSGFDGVTVTIGNGGLAGSSPGSTGGTGGSTTFGALLTAPGGSGGFTGQFATSVQTAFVPGSLGGSSPTGSGILYKASGQRGSNGFLLQNSQLGGDGGGSGKGGVGGIALGNSSFTCNPGSDYGTGAGGVTSTTSQSGKVGAAGAKGVVYVWEYGAASS